MIDLSTNTNRNNYMPQNPPQQVPPAPSNQSPKKSLSFFKNPKNHFRLGLLFLLLSPAPIAVAIFAPRPANPTLNFPQIPSRPQAEKSYSVLTGEEIADAKLNDSPTFCIQIPNGTDGARPQAGLDEAGVIFEAIAERKITRFAALFQNPSSAVIGPIRSLRMYYLEWDTPFNCTIVHAGGADDALAAVRAGNYRDLTENYAYMYRGKTSSRRWNNLFTTATNLKKFNTDRNFTSSRVTGFARLTPEDALKYKHDSLATEKLKITTQTDKNTSEFLPKVSLVSLNFTSSPNYNVVYHYNPNTNSYDRGYSSDAKHNFYQCPKENLGEKDPENACKLAVLSPKVVIALTVKEKLASDNYHENITTSGSNTVHIFQNGTVTKGTWRKNTRDEQLKFYDETGNEIKLAPGQTIVSAVPEYGKVEYQ